MNILNTCVTAKTVNKNHIIDLDDERGMIAVFSTHLTRLFVNPPYPVATENNMVGIKTRKFII